MHTDMNEGDARHIVSPRIQRRDFLMAAAAGSCAFRTTQLLGEERQAVASQSECPDITATFSIIAVDPENQVCGAAVASKYPAVGKVVPYVRADVGAFCTQHHHVPKWGELALNHLQQKKRPEEILLELLKDDENAEQRQLGPAHQ